MSCDMAWSVEDSFLSGSQIGVGEEKKKLSYVEPNCHVCNGNADQSKPMAQPVKAAVLQPF